MRVETIGDATLYLGDCAEVLPTLGRVDAVITDPPYGIRHKGTSQPQAVSGRRTAPRQLAAEMIVGDDGPFNPAALLGMADVVGLWGGNHFASRLPDTGTMHVWDKLDGVAASSFSDCEFFWVSHKEASRLFRYLWRGICQAGEKGPKHHPNQKPIAVMDWCLKRARASGLVLDPYMGSGATGVACVGAGLPFVGVEIEPRYFDVACRRIEQAYKQRPLFTPEPQRTPEQGSFLEAA